MIFTRRLLECLCLLLPVSIVVQGKKQEKEPTREIDKVLALRTHSLFAPYIDQDLQNRWWDFGADSYVNTNKHIRLTRAVPSQMGWIWSRFPLTAANFQVEAEFKISGEQSHLYGDGLATWLTKERAQPGPVFGSIDKFTGLGLFIDTYANGHHNYSFPRVIGMLGDGKTSYDQGGDGEANSVGACSAAVRRTNVATKLRITYVHEESLDVKIQYKGWDDWTDCFTLQDVTLPRDLYLGFSAMTGDVADAHDIISVSTYSVLMSGPTGSARSKLSSHVPAANTRSWFTFKGLLQLVFFSAVCAVAVLIVRAYAVQRGGLRVGGVDVLNRRGGFGTLDWQGSKRF